MTDKPGDRYNIRVNGGVSGQFTVGSDNTVSRIEAGRDAIQVTAADVAALRGEFARLRSQLPPDTAVTDQARDRLDELEEAVTAPEPDLSTMEYVRNWFVRNLPELAGAVTGLIVHPIVGQLVGAVGGTLAAEFQRRFGFDATSR
ncbi:hypothetical protein OHA40_01135 [Nocardia sp. NBC_00508]|uniref:hypothetical protein n=1 Tax=Nocardia sp. NBC_00508 TaxID=2975992 RepID=UPI002E8065F9|nr:hypothetical protein [Nocardia sp. NBC_00508]WUD66807.1 hypothetical protein OHA40_01135 [Nocardia sp. NBC_00508]